MTHLPPSQIWHQVFNCATARPFDLTGIQPFGFTVQVSRPYRPLVQEEDKNREVNPSRPLGNSPAIPRSKTEKPRGKSLSIHVKGREAYVSLKSMRQLINIEPGPQARYVFTYALYTLCTFLFVKKKTDRFVSIPIDQQQEIEDDPSV
ncbi:hypothetical protein LR48_Vigan08g120200 [Vigna angularis]|uniref:Uncharacterized protein n=1 Tax=Phaseolus angularis TaxID=3914 RepID=A0A0L9V5N7_PHAAN|nr:hypothetical protein LR48_Vigan08g120200 [Vigna angularis]